MISAVTGTPIGCNDPWVIPHPSTIESYGDTMPLSPIELAYSVIQSTRESFDSHSSLLLDEELDHFSSPYWATILQRPMTFSTSSFLQTKPLWKS
jgi:hypothetical protein